ncbi:MAG: hypothetical protein CMJ48_00560, partial [Planctomycetaceae bacterium]|nr:hypothetical protein [Planctomycetaceae bacterium]
MKLLTPLIAWSAALAITLLRMLCRIRCHADPRPELRAAGEPYIYSVLHAHQVAAVIDGEPGTGAMVSRSRDGELIVPGLRVRGIVPVRGSSHRNGKDRGGMTAFNALVEHVQGGRPAYLAVDGPRGPRNHVNKGIALLSQKTGAAVINIVPVPTRRWILSRAWDRLQIPKPFSTIHFHFGEPIRPRAGEDVELYRQRIEAALNALE